MKKGPGPRRSRDEEFLVPSLVGLDSSPDTCTLCKDSSLTYLVTLNSRSTLEATMSVAGGQNLPKSILYQGKYLILHDNATKIIAPSLE